MRTLLTKKFYYSFLISFLIFEGLLLLQTLSILSSDIFYKGFHTKEILEIIFYTSITLIGFSFLFGLLIATIFSFRHYSSNKDFKFTKELKSGAKLVIFVSFVVFGFNNWILPKAKLEMRSLLFEMQKTAAGESLGIIDKDSFKNYHSLMTIKGINHQLDTFRIQTNELKNECESLLSILPDSIAREEYENLKLADYEITYHFSIQNTLTDREIKVAHYKLGSTQRKLKTTSKKRLKYIKEKASRFVYSIQIFLLFLIGASFGYLYNDQKPFLLVVLGLYTTSFFYGTVMGFKRLVFQDTLNNVQGSVYSLLLLVFISSVFIIKGWRKEKELFTNNQ